MAILVGAILAVFVGILATVVGWDRDRSFYAVMTLVVASYYALFAVIGASSGILLAETLVALVFLAVAIVGYKKSLWIVMIALGGHGLFDLVHFALITNPGMPVYWPDFCASFDVVIAVYFAWRLKSGKIQA